MLSLRAFNGQALISNISHHHDEIGEQQVSEPSVARLGFYIIGHFYGENW